MGAFAVMVLFFAILWLLQLIARAWCHNRHYKWRRVVFPKELDMWGNCPICAIAFTSCPCPEPGHWGNEYRSNNNGILEARPIGDPADPDWEPYKEPL